MKKRSKSSMSRLAKQAKAIKLSPHLDGPDDSDFPKKKMEKAERILAKAGVPSLK